ncbi:MAG TPA: Rossmann-like and DUF2520 domain-containing protein [Phototrophicaceae bacterium]|nr:Rossmann-like and DUF2520 domain-containing protein [Phototrophicaceae bacterium]
MTRQPTLGFIGAGKVGSALARGWFWAGYTVRAIHSRRLEQAAALAAQVGAQAVAAPEAVLEAADLTLLTVPDGAIEPLVAVLKMKRLAGKAVIHTAGVHDASLLAALAEQGALIGSLHPAFPFASAAAAADLPGGITFAVETDAPLLRDWLLALVHALDGRVLVLPPGTKALYHAALVLASNYTVTLYALAEKLLLDIGAEREAADSALNILLHGTVDNLREKGIPAALTGPLVRADGGTIQKHLRALQAGDQPLADLYRQLARLTLPLVAARGVPTDSLKSILTEDDDSCV